MTRQKQEGMPENSVPEYKGSEPVIHRGQTQEKEQEPMRPELELTRQESRWIAFSALRSALLIGMIYLLGGALLIWFLLTIWH